MSELVFSEKKIVILVCRYGFVTNSHLRDKVYSHLSTKCSFVYMHVIQLNRLRFFIAHHYLQKTYN